LEDILLIIAEYASAEDVFQYNKKADIALEENFFCIDANSKPYRWKFGRIQEINNWKLTIAVKLDDYFDWKLRISKSHLQKEVHIWEDQLDVFGTHENERWYQHYDIPCFSSGSIWMEDRTFKSIRMIEKGDRVLSPVIPVAFDQRGEVREWCIATVTQVLKTTVHGSMPMVDHPSGFCITRGHPMYVSDGKADGLRDWYRPDELYPAQERQVKEILNFALDREHAFVVNGIVCCTVGRDCGQRLRALHPHQDLKYGPTTNLLHSQDQQLQEQEQEQLTD